MINYCTSGKIVCTSVIHLRHLVRLTRVKGALVATAKRSISRFYRAIRLPDLICIIIYREGSHIRSRSLDSLLKKKRVTTKKTFTRLSQAGSCCCVIALFKGYLRLRGSASCLRKNKKKQRGGKRRGEGGGRRGENRKREEDNAANSRCLLACSFLILLLLLSFALSLVSLPPSLSSSPSSISSGESIPTLTRLPLCSFALPAERRTRVTLFGRDKRGST